MEPQEGYHIRDLSYSVTGDNILVTTGSSTPMLYDRDGFLVAACLKGNLINIFFIFFNCCSCFLFAVTIFHSQNKSLIRFHDSDSRTNPDILIFS